MRLAILWHYIIVFDEDSLIVLHLALNRIHVCYKKLSCRRQAARCFLSLNISLRGSITTKMTPSSHIE